MAQDIRAAAIALYDRFTHEGLDRRAFMAEMTRIAGGAAAATALLASIAADPAAAALIAEDDARIAGRRMSWPVGGGRMMKGYQAEPKKAAGPLGSVLVVHENRGLNAHIEDVARRLAIAGYRAVAADFLSPAGGTPADQDAAREAIGKLDIPQAVADAVATLGLLKSLPGANGKAGAVGFCWGGGMVNRIAVLSPDLKAGVAYYGAQPPAADVAKIRAALLLHYAGLDERIDAGIPAYETALKADRKKYEIFVYPGVNHAFNNDTSNRYDKPAADLAWSRTVAFLKRELA